LTVVLGLFFVSSLAYADVIENKTGQRLEGTITFENDKQITVEVEGMELTLPKSDVRSIRRGPVAVRTKPRVAEPPATEAAQEPAAAPATPVPATIDVTKLERPVIVFDERQWKLGYQDARNSQVIAEFVLDGESVKDWNELVTAQLFIGLRTEPRYYVQYVKEKTAQVCPGAKWQTLKETPVDVLYEWSVKDCTGTPDQSEIARAVLGADGLHVLHYAVKSGEMSAQSRQKWTQCLLASQIVKPQQ
jgi:hypothetical protein